MSHDRTRIRRADARAFRPWLDGLRLEPRQLLTTVGALTKSQYLLTHSKPTVADALGDPERYSNHAPSFSGPVYNHGVADVNTALGGASALVAAPDGSRFRVSLSLAENQYDGGLSSETGSTGTNVIPSSGTPQPLGTVRVYPMPGGQVGIIVDGSTQYEQLTIDPLPFARRKGYAHSFSYGEAGRTHILNIGSIQINSGQIQSVLGFHSANLAGPLSIGGTGLVDRIAFNQLLPGAAIGVAGTLNTLDIANTATLTSGPGVTIGGDLNLLNIGGTLTLANGASFNVGRDMGGVLQPAKGTSTGSNILSVNIPTVASGITNVTLNPSVSAFIQGDILIGPGSTFTVGRRIDQAFYVLGNLVGGSRFHATGVPIQIPNPTYNPTVPGSAPSLIVDSSEAFIRGTIIP